jgi:hypothetical protein
MIAGARKGVFVVLALVLVLAVAMLPALLGVVLVGALLFAVLTRLGNAWGFARELGPLVNRTVTVEVWGVPLTDGGLEVEKVFALGVGLLIRLRAQGHEARELKVAQPRTRAQTVGSFEIAQAAYVMWEGKRLTRNPERPALLIRSRA